MTLQKNNVIAIPLPFFSFLHLVTFKDLDPQPLTRRSPLRETPVRIAGVKKRGRQKHRLPRVYPGDPEKKAFYERISGYRSLHSEFFSSISFIFHALFHFLRFFSRCTAVSKVGCTSQ